jgi:DNA-binding CsgD family transcriptional regulator
MLLVLGGNPGLDGLANALFLLLGQELARWTPRQCEVVRLYRRLQRQQDVARILGVSQQTVSSALASAGWRSLAGVEEGVARALDGYGRP